jgi:hypothetical protein
MCDWIYNPVFTDALTAVKLHFDPAIPSLSARREDLDHDVGCAPDPVRVYDATSRRGDDNDVRLDALARRRELDAYRSVQHDACGRVVYQRIQ